MNPIISIEGLGKKYLIDHQAQRQRYTALRDIIAEKAKRLNPFRGRSSQECNGRPRTEEFWALKNVSFAINQGDVVGIIGRNGAGKSTLLKLLSQITEPTAGLVRLRGRVASLLEVGTGFHPELTGRENIYLNGAILGMTRAEIKRKFDEIVAFAEVEKFLDTPVKRYSSGMYVRLAFAVAAHLDPEILVVDEVLSVGDAAFQKKCLGKMSDVARGGRTILFVSHNLTVVEALCPRSIHLAAGALVGDASTSEIVEDYLEQRRDPIRNADIRETPLQPGLVLERVSHSPPTIRSGDAAEIEICFRAEAAGQIRECAVLIYSAKGVRVAMIDPRESGILPVRYQKGRFTIVVRIAALPLVEGEFAIGVYLVTDQFGGDILDLDDFTVLSSRRDLDFAPYPADACGVLALNATSSVVSDRPVEAAR